MAEAAWGEVTFKKRPMRAGEARSQKVSRFWSRHSNNSAPSMMQPVFQVLNQAQRKGQAIDTTKKCKMSVTMHDSLA